MATGGKTGRQYGASRRIRNFRPLAMSWAARRGSGFLKRRRFEGIIFLVLFLGFFSWMGHRMGMSNMLNTIMQTAFQLLTNTVLFIMAITVLSGALAKLFVEFGVLRLLEFILKPLMRPLYRMPGVASLAPIMAFFSDNPAIISLAQDKSFKSYFTPRELVSLPNFGSMMGMGLVVVTYMSSKGFFGAAMVGLAGAMVGGIISTRLMQFFVRKELPAHVEEEAALPEATPPQEVIAFQTAGRVFDRFLNAILDGGKSGVDLGLAIIPGVLIISTFVTILTFGPKDLQVGYQGLAGEGVPVLTYLAGKISWFFAHLYGFQNAELVAFPVTSLGSVGAALSLLPGFIGKGLLGGNEVAVFTAMGMCWSGFLSSFSAIYDAIGYRSLTSRSLLAQTCGGLCAGIAAHFIFVLVSLI